MLLLFKIQSQINVVAVLRTSFTWLLQLSLRFYIEKLIHIQFKMTQAKIRLANAVLMLIFGRINIILLQMLLAVHVNHMRHPNVPNANCTCSQFSIIFHCNQKYFLTNKKMFLTNIKIILSKIQIFGKKRNNVKYRRSLCDLLTYKCYMWI